jgi:hypothetical protein
MPAESILSELMALKYEDLDVFEEIEVILEEIYKIENPGYEKQQKVEMDSFIQNMEAKEKKRLQKEKAKEEVRHDKLRQKPFKTSGFVDFSKLKNDK